MRYPGVSVVMVMAVALAAPACSSSKGGVRGGAAPLCTGKSGARSGKTARMVVASDVPRTFIVHRPAGLDPNVGAPVVFVHHGFTMTGQQMYDLTGYPALADRERFVAVFPDGEPNSLGPWNVGEGVCGAGAAVNGAGDDLGFLDAMLADIESDQCLDREHVFVTGFSMGGYFTHHAGCMRRNIAGIAPHSGGTHPFSGCPSGPKPVIMFHGTADPLIAPACAETARQQWVAFNGCAAAVDSRPVAGGHCEWSSGCPDGGQVVLCLFDGMGHTWAGGTAGQTYAAANTASASELTWRFWTEHAW